MKPLRAIYAVALVLLLGPLQAAAAQGDACAMDMERADCCCDQEREGADPASLERPPCCREPAAERVQELPALVQAAQQAPALAAPPAVEAPEPPVGRQIEVPPALERSRGPPGPLYTLHCAYLL